MKITFILPTLGLCGGNKIVFEYANKLTERGHEVNVIVPSTINNNIHLSLIIKRTFKLKRKLKLNDNKYLDWFDLKANLIIVPTFEEEFIPDADVIVATWWETAYNVDKYSMNKGNKFYFIQAYEIHAGNEEKVHKTYKLDLNKIVISKWLCKILKKLEIPESTIDYVPNAINYDIFGITKDIKNRPKRVAMLYNELPHKGAVDGLMALNIVKEEYHELKAVLFGLTPRPENLPEWIEYYSKPAPKELVEDIYNGSSIYLCPSWSEGWHLPPAEAMACGCSVVSTDIGGVWDYAIHEKTALLSPPKHPELLAKNLLKLIKDDKIRLDLAIEGNNYIKHFNWEESADKMETIFKKYSK